MRADGRLSRYGPEIADATTDAHGDLEVELKRCQVEAVSGICRTPDEVLGQLTDLRGELAEVAGRRGLRLLPSGCPIVPETEPQEITPQPRYLRMAEWFGATVRSVATCGCHVHVGIPDRETGVAVSNQLRPWLPVLLTITANSPFDGTDTGYASWRYQEWSRWPSAGPPPLFAGPRRVRVHRGQHAAVRRADGSGDDLLGHPALRTAPYARVPHRRRRGHPRARGPARHARPRPGRPRTRHQLTPPPPLSQTVLRANLWRASREGISGSALHPVTGELTPVQSQLDDLVELLRPVLGVGPGLRQGRRGAPA